MSTTATTPATTSALRAQLLRRPALARGLRLLLAALAALLLVSVLLELLGASAPTALGAIVDGSLGAPFSLGQTVMIASILALTGVAAAVPFSARLFNVGAEGQLYAGAIAATAVGFQLPHLPAGIHVPLLLLAGIAGGALWAAIPGVMKAYVNANEVIVSLMLTFVATLLAEYATTGIWPSGLATNTDPLPGNALLPTISSSTAITLGAPLAVVAVGATWVLMNRGALGFQIRATGFNARAAQLNGLPVRRIQVLAFTLGGAAAGLAGAILVAGVQNSLISGGAAGFGFLGIAVALVARLSAAWMIPSALLFAVLQVGSNALEVKAGISPSMGAVIVGVFVIALLALGAIRLNTDGGGE